MIKIGYTYFNEIIDDLSNKQNVLNYKITCSPLLTSKNKVCFLLQK